LPRPPLTLHRERRIGAGFDLGPGAIRPSPLGDAADHSLLGRLLRLVLEPDARLAQEDVDVIRGDVARIVDRIHPPILPRSLALEGPFAFAWAFLALEDELDLGDDPAFEGEGRLVDPGDRAVERDEAFLGILAAGQAPLAVLLLDLGAAGILQPAGADPLQ